MKIVSAGRNNVELEVKDFEIRMRRLETSASVTLPPVEKSTNNVLLATERSKKGSQPVILRLQQKPVRTDKYQAHLHAGKNRKLLSKGLGHARNNVQSSLATT